MRPPATACARSAASIKPPVTCCGPAAARQGRRCASSTTPWDGIGNLVERSDTIRGLTETFGYDNLYRLKRSALNGVTNLELNYDLLGNIASKSDVGTYGYDAVRKHRVVSAGSKAYGYDANGNVTARGGKAVTYNSFDKPTRINGAGSDAVTFEYDAEQNLQTIQNRPNGSSRGEMTTRVGELVERYFDGKVARYRSYIFGPTGAIAVQVRSTANSSVQLATHYLQRDHLNSVDEIDAQSGQPLVRTSYSAFGQARNAATWSGPQSATDAAAARRITDAGFTGHARVDLAGVIHMGGRVYDPLLGRFLSPDPNIDGVDDTQGWNRYSYVINNPLRFTDPSGYGLFGINFRFSFGGFFRGLASFFFTRRGGRGGCRGSLCLRNQTPTGPTNPEPPRPAPTPPPRPSALPPNRGPIGPRAGDPPIVQVQERRVDDFVDVTDKGSVLNRERYNAFLKELLSGKSFPGPTVRRQRALYEAVSKQRDLIANLPDAAIAAQYGINPNAKSYIQSVRDELDASLQRLADLTLAGAAVGQAQRVVSPSTTVTPVGMAIKIGSAVFREMRPQLRVKDFEFDCDKDLTAGRFECIVRTSVQPKVEKK
jgi:RHS repeat-associated protein